MSSINKRLIAKEERLHELFTQLDVTETGYLTAEEIESVLGTNVDAKVSQSSLPPSSLSYSHIYIYITPPLSPCVCMYVRMCMDVCVCPSRL